MRSDKNVYRTIPLEFLVYNKVTPSSIVLCNSLHLVSQHVARFIPVYKQSWTPHIPLFFQLS